MPGRMGIRNTPEHRVVSQTRDHRSPGMAQEFKPGQIVPESGVYRITHDPVHADMPHEVTVIRGRRFPTCRHCKGISFELVYAAKHVDEVLHLHEEASIGAGG